MVIRIYFVTCYVFMQNRRNLLHFYAESTRRELDYERLGLSDDGTPLSHIPHPLCPELLPISQHIQAAIKDAHNGHRGGRRPNLMSNLRGGRGGRSGRQDVGVPQSFSRGTSAGPQGSSDCRIVSAEALQAAQAL